MYLRSISFTYIWSGFPPLFERGLKEINPDERDVINSNEGNL